MRSQYVFRTFVLFIFSHCFWFALKDLRLKLRHLSNLTSSQAVPPKLLFRFYEQIVIIVRIPEPNKSHPSRSEWAGKTVLLPNRYLPSLSTLPSQPPVPGHLTFRKFVP